MDAPMKELIAELTKAIQDSYDSGITVDEAEKLASKFLYAQLQISIQLQAADLDSRMQKTGVKAIRSAVYLKEATKGDKKPSDVMLDALVSENEAVITAQDLWDKAEVAKDLLENYFNVFREAHIHFRGISRGRYE